jgi:hypothetical protein
MGGEFQVASNIDTFQYKQDCCVVRTVRAGFYKCLRGLAHIQLQRDAVPGGSYRHAQGKVVAIAECDEAEGLEHGVFLLLKRIQHFCQTLYLAGICLKRYLNEITLSERSAQL